MQKSKQHRKRVLKDLGNAIRNRRVDLGLSQHELAEKADLHRTHVTDIEGGLRNISFLTLLRVAHGLDCALSTLVADAERAGGFRSR